MPIPAAVLAALAARGLAAAARISTAVAFRLWRMSRAALQYVARLAARVMRATRNAATALRYRVLPKLRALARKAQQGFIDAINKVMRLLRRVANAVRRLIQRVVSRFSDGYVALDEESRRRAFFRDTTRQLRKNIENALMESEAAFYDAIEEAAMGIADEDEIRQRIAEMRKDALRDRIRQIARDFVMETISRDEAMAEFIDRVIPAMIAERIVAAGDVGAIEDQDIAYEALEYLAMFSAFLEEVERGTDMSARAMRMVEGLVGEMDRAVARSRYRHTLLRLLLHDASVSVDVRAVFWQAAGELQDARELVESMAEDARAVARGERSMRDFLATLVDRAREMRARQAEFAGLVTRKTRKLISAAYERGLIDSEAYDDLREQLKQPMEVAQEQAQQMQERVPAVYGVWRLNCTRSVNEHCKECLALNALTHTYPVPIEDLPIPGTSTPCYENCACCVEQVGEEEFGALAIEYWSERAARAGADVSAVLRLLEDDPMSLLMSMTSTGKYQAALHKWYAKLIDASQEQEDGAS